MAANITWVDSQTFAWYAGITKGAPKRKGSRAKAIRTCTDTGLREYYKTGDETWRHECWKEMEKRVVHIPDGEDVRADCYLYSGTGPNTSPA